jgi:hypothetical protein
MRRHACWVCAAAFLVVVGSGCSSGGKSAAVTSTSRTTVDSATRIRDEIGEIAFQDHHRRGSELPTTDAIRAAMG